MALRRLPFEHRDQALAIAETLGEVIGFDTANETARDPRFCVNLMVTNGWVTNIDLESEDGLLPTQKILVDYDKLPMRCKACHSWKHRVRDSNEFPKRFVRGGRRPAQAPPLYQKEKGKNVDVDDDGFQLVNNCKHTRRNIFDNDNTEARSSVPAQAAEARQGRMQTTQHAGEAHRPSGNQHEGENTVENNKKGLAGSSLQDGAQGGCDGERRPATSGAYRSPLVISTTEEEVTVRLESVVEGRGVPASTMQWSPRKHAGHKRPLEAEEHLASEEDDSGSEAATEDSDEENLGEEADDAQGEDSTSKVGELMQIDNSEEAATLTASIPQGGDAATEGLQPAAAVEKASRHTTVATVKATTERTTPSGGELPQAAIKRRRRTTSRLRSSHLRQTPSSQRQVSSIQLRCRHRQETYHY